MGCFGCWASKFSQCVIKDDMAELLEKINDADMIVYGTPLNKYGVSGFMKDFIDRKQPLLSPRIERIEGRIRHPEISGKSYTKKEVLIVNCGFSERRNFNGLIESFGEMTLGKGHVIALNCGEMLGAAEYESFYAPYRSAIKDAAKEIILDGRISQATQAVFEKDVIDHDLFMEAANQILGEKYGNKKR